MKRAEAFDAAAIELRGTRLIEASAGTGKTYSIALLFLRLVLEERIPLEQILVVTYTRAATAELKDRIRKFLRMAMKAWEGKAVDNGDVARIVEKSRSRGNFDEGHNPLHSALLCLDEAAIFTIHGFCQRVLGDNAFETGSAYDTEMVTDQDDIVSEIVTDFYRKKVSTAPRPVLSYLQAQGGKVSIKGLSGFINSNLSHQLIRVHYPDEMTPDEAMRRWQALKGCWKESSGEIKRLLETSKSLKRQAKYLKPDGLPLLYEAIENSLGDDTVDEETLSVVTQANLDSRIKKGAEPVTHEFFRLCEEALRYFQGLVAWYRGELYSFVRRELPWRKENRNIQYYDDLLFRLYEAIKNSSRGKQVTETLRRKYRAALIDEFQDTDGLQYHIFKTVFDYKDSILYLIGDPKQSIYGFRGADVFSYMEASRSVGDIFTLSTNWRSEKPLVQSFNELFGREAPFLFDEINYENVQAGGEADKKPLLISGGQRPPLVIWNISSEEPLAKTSVRGNICEAVASEIVSLLSGKSTLEGRPLRAGDMAVLVQSWYEGREIKSALERFNIPAIMSGASSVFASQEAAELYLLLRAVMEPSNERALRGALITELLGYSLEGIEVYNMDDTAREKWMGHFRRYHRQWEQKGFIAMITSVMAVHNIKERLVMLPEGERRITNLFHLTELLHRESLSGSSGMHDLMRWFDERVGASETRSDEYELRLESDESAVAIVTIHRSKGLQYPVVFCPFTWDEAKLRDRTAFTYHSGPTEILTLGTGDEKESEEALREILAEKLRLFYVAVTRAEHRCYLCWGNFNQSENSSGRYFLHDPEGRFIDSSVISVEPLPEPVGPLESVTGSAAELQCPLFEGPVPSEWRISSFSAMSGDSGADPRDRDGAVSGEDAEPPVTTGREEAIFTFPRGTRAGTALHSIFEVINFSEEDHTGAIEGILNSFNLAGDEGENIPVIEEMVRRVLTAELPSERPFSLSSISGDRRINELEFYFSVPDLAERDFSFLEGNGTADPFTGFVHGFIDLVFKKEGRYYIVDWKSNYLGNRAEDYDRESLHRAVVHHRYNLQYMIYSLALHRYLSGRIDNYRYDVHFGGVFYIFLRGVRPGTDYGIYSVRPSLDDLGRMEKVFGLEDKADE